MALSHINGPSGTPLKWFAFQNPAVDVFFCLSGFTLCLAYGAGTGRSLHFREFIIARVARVYPLYFLVLACSAIYSAAWGFNNFSSYRTAELVRDTICQLLMINALPIIGSGVHWVDPMWSLSIEAFCYAAIFPILFSLSNPASSFTIRALLIGMISCGFTAFAIYALFYDPNVNTHHIPPVTGTMVHWVAILRGICMFSAGWFAYLLYRRPNFAATPWTDAVSIAMVMILAAQGAGIINGEIIVMLTPLLICGLGAQNSVTAKLLSLPALHFLGRISYSLYLLHWPAMVLVWQVLPALRTDDAVRIPLTSSLAFASAIISFFLIERPSRLAIRKLSARCIKDQHSATDAAAPTV